MGSSDSCRFIFSLVSIEQTLGFTKTQFFRGRAEGFLPIRLVVLLLGGMRGAVNFPETKGG